MKIRYIGSIAILLIIGYGIRLSGIKFDDLTQTVTTIVGGSKSGSSAASAALALQDLDAVQQSLKYMKEYGDQAQKAYAALSGSQTVTPVYCSPEVPAVMAAINSKTAQSQDSDQLLNVIAQYSPVLYLYPNEKYLPINAENYFTAPGTAVKHKERGDIIAKGKVTMQKLYDLRSQFEAVDTSLYIANDTCTNFGLNPKIHSGAKGVLNSPAYVYTGSNPTNSDKIYIVYIFLYGFNGPFALHVPDLPLDKLKKPADIAAVAMDIIKTGYIADKASPALTADVLDLQGAHEGDIEHVTLEIDAKSKKPLRIFYAAHGGSEGSWLDYNSSLVSKSGKHPIVYVADHSHACYPQEGSYIRVFGFANDVTKMGQRWEPQWYRIYNTSDERFDAATMGGFFFPGTIGPRGVSDVSEKPWFKKPGSETGRSYDSVQKLFCTLTESTVECIGKKRIFAKLP